MATTPTAPVPTAAVTLLEQAMSTGLKVNVSGTLPGQELLTTIITTWEKFRESMDPALRARYDAVVITQIEDLQAVWRGLWVTLGVLK